MKRLTWLGAALVAAGFGCAEPVHHGGVGTNTAIHAAVDAGAERDARAATYLQFARNDLASASHYGVGTDAGDRALARAHVDSEVALAYAQDAKMRAEVIEQQRKIQELKP